MILKPLYQVEENSRKHWCQIASTTIEHAHALLIGYIQSHALAKIVRSSVMIEIGATRELVPGQGSTEKLASLGSVAQIA